MTDVTNLKGVPRSEATETTRWFMCARLREHTCAAHIHEQLGNIL